MAEPYAMVFPGQGSQSLGMLQEIYTNQPIIKDCFDEASEVLSYDVWDVIQHNEVKLNQTEVTQPALLVADVALYRCWQQQYSVAAAYFAGHSLGEYSALVCAESLSLSEAVWLVEKRGQYMQQAVAVGEGAMAAIIGLDCEKVQALCDEVAEGHIISPANFNSPGQIVVSGESQAVQRAVAAAKSHGAKLAKLLAVSVPSHCRLMQSAQQPYRECMAQVSWAMPCIPVIHNTIVASAIDIDDLKEHLINQLVEPVRWVETVQCIQKNNINVFLECGPGKVLSSLGKRINKKAVNCEIGTWEALQRALDEVK